MRFCSITSGSSGNCHLIETGQHRLLIDIGLSAKQIEKLLNDREIDPASITAVFVTHEHTDHTKGVGVWMRRYRVPVMATAGTWKGMERTIGQVPGELRVEIRAGKGYRMSDLRIEAVPTCHDANDPCGYVVESGGSKAAIITDTGMLTPLMQRHLCETDLAVLECNHDIDMLMQGPYPMALKKRIRSNMGHLSNEDCGYSITEARQKGSKGIFLLGHLSQENNTPQLAMDTVRQIVDGSGQSVEGIYLTKREQATEMFII